MGVGCGPGGCPGGIGCVMVAFECETHATAGGGGGGSTAGRVDPYCLLPRRRT